MAPGGVLSARASPATTRHPSSSRGWRGSSSAGRGEPIATVGPVEILASARLDPAGRRARIAERRAKLEAEVKRGEGKLANEGFVAKAPAEVVEAEREKLERYRAELDELAELAGSEHREPRRTSPRSSRRLAVRARADGRSATRSAGPRTPRRASTSSGRTASRR